MYPNLHNVDVPSIGYRYMYMYSNLQYIDVSSIGYRLMSPCINQEKLSQLTSSPEQYVYKI